MSFAFLHPEFFFWMLPPVAALFYFWLTQQSEHASWLEEAMLKRLRAPETTMGLKGRNTLFLAASVLLITAMAEPVLVDPMGIPRPRLILAVDMNGASSEPTRLLALEALKKLENGEVGVIAFAEGNIYRIAPMTFDHAMLRSLIVHLPALPEGERTNEGIVASANKVASASRADGVWIVSAGRSDLAGEGIRLISDSATLEGAFRELQALMEMHRNREHVPLFYYPLGLAMLLVWIALSSMSKRRTVTLALFAGVMIHSNTPADAGIFDFTLLKEAKQCYDDGQYLQSAALYAQYQQNHDSPQVRYNRANALYRAGRFEKAAYWYDRVYTSDPVLREWSRYNGMLARRQTETSFPEYPYPKKAGAGIPSPRGVKGVGNGKKGETVLFEIR